MTGWARRSESAEEAEAFAEGREAVAARLPVGRKAAGREEVSLIGRWKVFKSVATIFNCSALLLADSSLSDKLTLAVASLEAFGSSAEGLCSSLEACICRPCPARAKQTNTKAILRMATDTELKKCPG
mmetsp:Transcript_67973/g.124005  ORF Transcript_67973/g.124005 Transcript_67973/m.124005 type:complete len:128 (+) Transcript_67973:977-1360(+)